MTHALNSAMIAIANLVDHPANVRAKSTEDLSPENLSDLIGTLPVLGLLQPLLVQEIDGKYGVLAGRRRCAALKLLASDKTQKGFNSKTKIDCRIVPADCDLTTAMSLAENVTQKQMGAIDEFEAFARMMEVDEQTPETIATIFGTTVAAVKGRLRYGLVHPDIREAARAKSITLDVMKAFADHPSQDVQKEVFDALIKDDGYIQAYTVRSALKSRGIQVSDAAGAFVREEYEARGGTVAADLLEEHSVLEDNALVETIMTEQLLAAAESKRDELGFSWADAVIRYDYGDMADFGRVYPSPIEPDEDGQKRLTAIDTELEKLATEMEDESIDDETYNALSDRVDALATAASDLQEAYSSEDLGRAGVIASWNGRDITLHIGMVRPEDKPGATPSADATNGGTDEQDTDEIVYPDSLSADLKTERAMALGAAMTMSPEATLDLTLFKLVSDVICSRTVTRAVSVDARKQYRSHAKMDDIDATSLEQFAATQDELDMTWADDAKSPAEQFKIFRGLDQTEKGKLVAFATASTTESCFARSRNIDSLMHDFEIEVMPNIRDHWTPNAALFNRFKKAWLLKILNEELGLTQEALTLASSSKKDIVAFCDKLFAEPFATLTDAQRDAVATWCPPMMQTTGGYAPERLTAPESAPEAVSEAA